MQKQKRLPQPQQLSTINDVKSVIKDQRIISYNLSATSPKRIAKSTKHGIIKVRITG
jgi:hypothetical protein